jgi:hypothetical protein
MRPIIASKIPLSNPFDRDYYERMKSQAHFLTLCCVVLLVGCAVQNNTPSTSTPTLGPAENWQIEQGTSITVPPAGAFLLTGALQTQGSQITGIFGGTPLCGTPQVLSFSGTIDSAGNLTLAPKPPYFYLQLAVPANPTTVSTGTMAVTGQFCALASAPAPAVGVEIASLTGNFSGQVNMVENPIVPLGMVANVSLALTQSNTPNASAQFPLTGSITYTNSPCSETIPVTGTVSGVGITVASASAPVSGQNYVSFTGSTNPTATQLTASNILFEPIPCSTGAPTSTISFTGTVNRQ